MTTVILSDNSTYKLKEDEHLTFGQVGVYVWKGNPDKETGEENYPPIRFYVYGFVKEVRNE